LGSEGTRRLVVVVKEVLTHFCLVCTLTKSLCHQERYSKASETSQNIHYSFTHNFIQFSSIKFKKKFKFMVNNENGPFLFLEAYFRKALLKTYLAILSSFLLVEMIVQIILKKKKLPIFLHNRIKGCS
jgi:hypothetical protein